LSTAEGSIDVAHPPVVAVVAMLQGLPVRTRIQGSDKRAGVCCAADGMPRLALSAWRRGGSPVARLNAALKALSES
jgi:hypothetical protein